MRLLLPKSLASAGWDIVKSRPDVEGVLFDDEDLPESLHPALRGVDGVALGHTSCAPDASRSAFRPRHAPPSPRDSR